MPPSLTPPAPYHATSRASNPASAWVALGSNLGDRRGHLRRALRWLDALPDTRVRAISPFVRTAPVGPPQPDYLNAVVHITTPLAPLDLLASLLVLERAAGRDRRSAPRWGARSLDLDLLLVRHPTAGWRRCDHPNLTLPHPRLEERIFVLEPLGHLDPDLVLPSGATVRARLAALRGSAEGLARRDLPADRGHAEPKESPPT